MPAPSSEAGSNPAVQTISNKKPVAKKPELIFKFNGGTGAVLCTECRVIIATGSKAFDMLTTNTPQYCVQHQQIVAGLSPASPSLGEQTE